SSRQGRKEDHRRHGGEPGVPRHVARRRADGQGSRAHRQEGSARLMSEPLVILDVGSTLVHGPDQGPASRIAALCGLESAGKEALSRALMVTNFAGPAAVSGFLLDRFGLDRERTRAAVEEDWAKQEIEARPIDGATDVIEALAANG